MIPGMQYVRLSHRPFQAQVTEATIKVVNRTDLSENSLIEYRLNYTEIKRDLKIVFSQKFPHEILYWEERSGHSKEGDETLVTRATRKKSMLLDYWHKNAVADSTFRIQLGL
jgi:hypothetical protein